MRVKDRPLQEFIDKIKARTPFTFSRWGDGEWHSVLGRTKGMNCDGHRYFAAMGHDLRRLLLSRPGYVLGMQSLALRVLGTKIQNFINKHRLHKLDWIDADVFHKASQHDRLQPLVEAVRATEPVVVGPPHLCRLKEFLNYSTFITVPPKDSYLALNELTRTVFSSLERAPVGKVVSVSAGMPAKLLVDSLHRRFGATVTILDFGSVWDPYVGVRSRRYMQGMQLPRTDP